MHAYVLLVISRACIPLLSGHEYSANDDFEKAMACYRSAIRIDERHYNAWYGLGNIYYRQEKCAALLAGAGRGSGRDRLGEGLAGSVAGRGSGRECG